MSPHKAGPLEFFHHPYLLVIRRAEYRDGNEDKCVAADRRNVA
ncbi:hypothetical protein ES702_00605 [subsurface metagenome]